MPLRSRFSASAGTGAGARPLLKGEATPPLKQVAKASGEAPEPSRCLLFYAARCEHESDGSHGCYGGERGWRGADLGALGDGDSRERVLILTGGEIRRGRVDCPRFNFSLLQVRVRGHQGHRDNLDDRARWRGDRGHIYH